jgi:arabinofuranan 3-O-arabinosyltransferase
VTWKPTRKRGTAQQGPRRVGRFRFRRRARHVGKASGRRALRAPAFVYRLTRPVQDGISRVRVGLTTAQDQEPGPAPSRAQLRLRLAAICLGITLLVFSQSSGDEAADTKLDLAVSPWHFLVQSVSAWDPTAAAGTLQNQAYGYLFPMGPFFVVGHLMHLSPWVTQRGWESLLLVAAFLGMFRLSRLLGVADWWPRVAAGLTYAMAPRMLMEIGVISSELMPVAAAPWVLIPLVRGAREGSPRRAAAWSGVALLFAGGTNAAATLAILPIPALWLLTRERGPRRAALMRWWVAAVALACLWWAIPLAVLGKYSPPFLNWIESAAVTTSQTSLATSLRGAEHWEAYLGRAVWPAGYIFVSVATVVFATAVVAAIGLIGLTLRRNPQRLFLGTCLAAGLVLVTFGHVASVGPLLAMTERTSLDGPFNAFRNVHKFDPLIRLPIAIGVGNVVAAGIARWSKPEVVASRRSWRSFDPRGVAAVVALYVAVAAIAPALTGNLVAQARGTNEPTWWSQAATWLGQQGPDRTLVVPGAAQPAYIWGSPRDDALQPVAKAPWTVRDSVPLTQPGYIRLLDEIEARMAAGRDDPTLATVLARSGIRYIAVRNDLDTAASQATPLQFIYATLDNSTGFREVNSFGSSLLSTPDHNRLIDEGATTSQPAITIFENTRWTGNLSLLPVSQAVEANGSADNLSQLTAAGVRPDQPVIFAPSTLPPVSGPPLLTAQTDGIRRREFAFGSINQYSSTFTATQPFRVPRAAQDYLPTPAPALSTVAYRGIRDITDSSSGADADALLNASPANGPWAAVDANPATAWRIGSLRGAVGQWLQLDLLHAISPSVATVAFVGNADGYPDRIDVETAAGHLDEAVKATGAPQRIALPPGSTGFVRLTITGVDHDLLGAAAGVAELTIPSVTASRTLNVPGAGQPDIMTFEVAEGHRDECLSILTTPACDPTWAQTGEEDGSLDRTVTLSDSTTYKLAAQVTLRPGTALDQRLDQAQPLTATASSVDTNDPRQRAGAAVDGDPTTGWMASPANVNPTLVVRTTRRHLVTGVELSPLIVAAARAPVEVLVTVGRESVDEPVPKDGIVTLNYPVKSRTVSIHVIRAAVRVSVSSSTGLSQFLPIGIAEVTLLGPHEVKAHNITSGLRLGCDAGLTISVNGQSIPMQVNAPREAVLDGTPVTATLCPAPGVPSLGLPASTLSLTRGTDRLVTSASPLTEPESLTLTRVGQSVRPVPVSLPARTLTWKATSRSVTVRTNVAALLVVHENLNAGWQATFDGRVLRSVMVDGWQQAWLVPADTHGVIHLRFTPQAAFTAGLIGGGGAAALLVLLTLPPVPLPRWRRRRSPRSRPALRAAAPNRAVRWAAVAGFLTGLGSVTGLAVGCVLIVLDVAVNHRVLRPRGTWIAVGLTLGAASVAETIRTVTSSTDPLAGSPGVQLLCLFAVGLVLLACFRTPIRMPRAGKSAK